MAKKKNFWIGLAVAAVAIAVALVFICSRGGWSMIADGETADEEVCEADSADEDADSEENDTPSSEVEDADESADSTGEDATAEDEPDEPENEPPDENEVKVDAFDNLTDKWMEPAKGGVTMKDVEAFSKTFRAVPKERQDECVHRALNLIPDENVMLLAGILMDKSMDKDIVETVFNDVLNRDEDIKKPILEIIFKDKTHPCWADTAWILDVTGELPNKKEQGK